MYRRKSVYVFPEQFTIEITLVMAYYINSYNKIVLFFFNIFQSKEFSVIEY